MEWRNSNRRKLWQLRKMRERLLGGLFVKARRGCLKYIMETGEGEGFGRGGWAGLGGRLAGVDTTLDSF